MGLCKCPKRRVTNQFCFEHRVNVCEYCMVTNHPKCIIQSYLQWLQDSDYNPICEICTNSLSEGECIRLTCYHVFHWACTEARYRALPRTTAPAGYQCPSCATPVFPPQNLVSPVADVLREKLAGVNWARAGLGLPLLSEDQDLKGAVRRSQSPEFYASADSQRGTPVGASDDESNRNNGAQHSVVQIPDEHMYDHTSVKRSDSLQGTYSDSEDQDLKGAVRRSQSPEFCASADSQRGTPVGASDDESNRNNGAQHSVVQIPDEHMYDHTSVKRSDSLQGGQASRKGFKTIENAKPSTFDHDENKYKQKSTFAWMSRWWKNTMPSSRVRRAGGIYRRYWILLFVIIAVVIVLLVLSHRTVDEENPFGFIQDEDHRILQKN